MAQSQALTPLDPNDYGAIEAAVLETARGRWFLAEYARRNRTADTQILLGAIARLEQSIVGEHVSQDIERVRFDLMKMANAIAQAKVDVLAMALDGPGTVPEASGLADAIADVAEQAATAILDSAEAMQEAAWNLRESGADTVHCDALDERATRIYTACAAQDLALRRARRVLDTVHHLDGRINAMLDAWSPEPASASIDGKAATQERAGSRKTEPPAKAAEVVTDADWLEMKASAAPAPARDEDAVALDEEPLRPATPTTAVHPRRENDVVFVESAEAEGGPFAAFDNLSAAERLRRFT